MIRTLLFFLLVLPASAQPFRAWIVLRDHAGAAPVELAEATRARRALRGTVGADSLLSPRYLAALERLGVRPERESRWLNAVTATLTPDVAARVAALPFVRRVQPVARMQPVETPEAFSLGTAATGPRAVWTDAQLDAINARTATAAAYDGTGVTLGFLDTVFDSTHVAFAGQVAEGRWLGTRAFTPGAQTDRHALAVSSIAAGFVAGVYESPAPGASLVGATTEYAPTERNLEEDAFVAGLEWLEARGADVVNVSLGYTVFDAGQHSYTTADLDGDTGITTRAADAAAARGVVMVIAAGNEGCSSPASCWYYISTPADGDSVITVGAVRLDSTLASFSSRGPTADGRLKPDVVAPGAAIAHARPGGTFGTGNGTSYAAPLVSGVVAKLLQARPTLTPMEVRDVLRQTASQATNPDNLFGWGIVNADAALRSVTGAAPATTALAVRLVQNPVQERLRFDVQSPVAGPLRLTVYDALGREVLGWEGAVAMGRQHVDVRFDAPPGLYAFRLTCVEEDATGTFVRAR